MELQNKPRKKKIEMEVQRFLDEMNRQLKATSIRKKKKNEREKKETNEFLTKFMYPKRTISNKKEEEMLTSPTQLCWFGEGEQAK